MEIKTKFDIGQTIWTNINNIYYTNGMNKPYKSVIDTIHFDGSVEYSIDDNKTRLREEEIFATREECEKAIKESVK